MYHLANMLNLISNEHCTKGTDSADLWKIYNWKSLQISLLAPPEPGINAISPCPSTAKLPFKNYLVLTLCTSLSPSMPSFFNLAAVPVPA